MTNPSLILQPTMLAAQARQVIQARQAVQSGQAAQAAQAAPIVQVTRTDQTRAAIAQAAQRTGVDFSYLLAQAEIESGMDPRAQAPTSSATGLYQFIDQTWLATLDQHGEQLGYGEIAQGIDTVGGRAQITDPAMRDTIMSLRYDPQAASLMAGALANDNRAALTPVLGREPDASELYLAHFLGAQGATDFLTNLAENPDISAASIMPQAARANRAIFYEGSGAPHSVSAVMDLVRGKVETAMQNGQNTSIPQSGWYPVQGAATPTGVSRAPAITPAQSAVPATIPAARPATRTTSLPAIPTITGQSVQPALPTGRPRPSMADTLSHSFGLTGDNASLPGQTHVRNAYARLAAFGL